MFAGINAGGLGTPFRFFTAYSNQPSQYVSAPAPAYDAYSIFDSASSAGNFSQQPLTLNPSADALLFDAGGIPYTLIPAIGRQSFKGREYSFAGLNWIATLDADGISETYYINDQPPVENLIIGTQAWYTHLPIAAIILDDHFSDPEGDSLVYVFNSLPAGLSVQTHIYNPGLPNQRTVQQIEGTISGLGNATINGTITDIAGASINITAFNYTGGAGVQVPNDGDGTVNYLIGSADVTNVGLVPRIGFVISAVTPGNIISMSPSYPSYVAPGTQISLTVSEMGVGMPNVVGLTLAAAVVVLQASNLLLSPAASPAFSDTVPAGLVISQSPAAGSFIAGSAVVILTVSIGPAPEFGTNLANYVGPPKTKATYASNYPRWMYHPTHQPIIVPDAFTEEALINYDPQWREKP